MTTKVTKLSDLPTEVQEKIFEFLFNPEIEGSNFSIKAQKDFIFSISNLMVEEPFENGTIAAIFMRRIYDILSMAEDIKLNTEN